MNVSAIKNHLISYWFALTIVALVAAWRYIVQGYFVLRGTGELNKFTENNSLPAIVSAYLKAYVNIFAKLPAMLLKRRRFRKKQHLGTIDMFNLIWQFHLSMSEIIGMRKR